MSAKPSQLEPIAIIGTACRFPGGANSPSRLWEVLRNPLDLASGIPDDRFNADGFYSQNGQYHGHGNAKEGYFLTGEGVTRRFDASFFGMSPAEATCLDPQCRLSLETVYEALESAGLTIESLRGSDTAVYAGQMVYDYEQIVTRDSDGSAGIYHASGTSHAVTSNRISYFFDWHGPSMTIDTACSSSLVAFHCAVQQLRSGLSGVAVATGVNLLLDPGCFISLSSLNMLSPDGRSRMWSANANGYARGEGIAAVVLKPLTAALRDGDGIECIVRETGFCQDGRTAGLISPNAEAQVQLIRGCYARAGLDLSKPADRPQFFECHGTGTQAGDAAEAKAIATAFCLATNDAESAPTPLKVGSIKTVIGHTEGAAGLAGIMKASLALQNTTFPPNLLFDSLNPRIRPFYTNVEVSTTASSWLAPLGGPRRASVNSFGFAGANAHAILESYSPEAPQPSAHISSHTATVFTPFVFSASTETSLVRYLSDFKRHISEDAPKVNLRDLAYTLYARRSCFPVTTFITASDAHDLCSKIDLRVQAENVNNDQPTDNRIMRRRHTDKKLSILGVFTGQGAQWAGMASSLIKASPAIRSRIQLLEARLSRLPEAHRPSWSLTEELESFSPRVNEAAISQPICTAVQILQVDILRATGLEFSAIVGHSSGEIAAAYAAGLISADDAICIAYYRGLSTKVGTGAKHGAMMAVGTSAADAQELLDDPWLAGRACVAAINSPASVTLSGDDDAIDQLKIIFDDERKFARKLQVDMAYHSHHMHRCSAPYRQFLSELDIQVTPGNESVWFSSVFDGESLSGKENLLKGDYWDMNMTRPVMFKQAIEHAHAAKGPFDMTLELGPHPALKGPILQTLQDFSGQVQILYTSLFKRGTLAIESVSDGLGYLWSCLGSKTVNLKGYDKFASNDATLNLIKGLPSYAWDHQNEYWNESRYSRAIRHRGAVNELLGHLTPDSTEQDIRWRHILKPAELPWLMCHLIQDQIVFPAAGYLATAVEAAMGVCQQRKVVPNLIELLDVEFDKALVFDHENAEMEIVVSLTDIVSRTLPRLLEATFKYHAADARGTSSLELFASGRVQISLGDPSVDVLSPIRAPQPPNLLKIREEDYYSASRDIGYHWTGPFVALDKCWRRFGFATGVLNIVEPSELVIPPPVLDAAFQGTLLAYSYPYDGQNWALNVPGKVKRMTVNPSLCSKEVAKMEPLPFDATHDAEIADLYANVDVYPSGNVENAIIQVEGLKCVPISAASVHDDKEAFATVTWDIASPDVQLVIEDNDTFTTKENTLLARHLERMAIFYLRQLKSTKLPAGAESHVPEEIHHLLRYATQISSVPWTGAWQEWESDTEENLKLAGEPFRHIVDVQMIETMGVAIGQIANGLTSASEAILDNSILSRFHSDALGPRRYNMYLARIMKQLVHRNPHMDLLEVGAGTGAATRAILDSINPSTFASYTFTDISTGFFESAKTSWSQPYMHKVAFKRLDISQGPMPQGFIANSYDVVVAALVLHATPSLEQTLHNLWLLLKPGGYLVVLELLPTKSTVYSVIFGSTPSWWHGMGDEGRVHSPAVGLPQWDSLLRRTGFSGCDTATPAHEDSDCSSHFSLFVSQAMDDNIAFMRHPLTSSPLPDLNDSSTTLIPRLVMVGGTSPRTSTLMEQIQNRVSQYCTSLTIARSVSAIPKSELSADTTVLSLVDIDDPMLAHIDEEGWNSLREVLMTAGTLLWVTQGRLATVPHSNMMVGLLRSIVREVPSLNYRALDFEDVCIMNANIISEALLRFKAEILWRQQDKGLSTTVENELVINSQGGIMIPRFVTSQPMNDRYNSARRTIIGNFDRRTQNLTLVRRGSGESPTISRYELRQEAEVNSDNRHHGPSSGVIDAMYSIVSAVRVSRFGCLYAAIGECRASGKQVVFLSRTQSSIIRTPEQLVVRLDARIDSDREVTTLLSLVVYKLLALAALEDLSRGDIVPVHDPDLEFATALEEEARSAGIKTVMVASTRRTSSAAADYLMIHPSASDRAMAELLHLYVQNDSCYSFIDLSVPEADRSLANRIQSLLPAHCRQHTTRSLLSSTAWAAPSSQHLDKIQDRLDKAVHYGLARCKVSSSASAPVVPLQSPVVDVDETRASFSVLDWTSGGTNNVKSALIRPIDTQIAFSNHKTYWLAGLSGGLGIALCEWMARRNAKYFVISSRTPKVSESWLVAMRQKGVTVKIAACDLTIREQVTSLHADICASMPPIAGVTQGANSWEDTAIEEMNLETFLRGTRPKVEGSISLNNLFQDDTLDFFVFFSSVVAVVGRPGQAYYSAANIFMAALAEQRRRKGLAASVIHIGPIYGLGYASEQGNGILNKERLRSSALVPVSEREFYQLFSEAVMVGRPGSVQGPMEFLNGVRRVNRYDDDQPDWAGESMMSHWIKTSDALAATLASDTELKVPLKMQLFEARDSTQVHSIVLDALFPKICSIFQIDSKKIDKKALETMRLDEMGIDSLVAVEIRSWFVKTLEIDVPVLKILSGVPIGDLVSFAAEKIPDKFVPNLASSHSTTKEDYSEKSDPPTSEAEDYGLDSQGHSSLIDEVVSSEASSEIFSAALKVNIDENNGSFNEDATTVKASPIVQRILRLSFSQELLWFVWSFLGDKTSLNHTAWARITGEISETGIREAFRSVSQQHEALRTRFIIENGRPVQAIMASSMWDLEVKSIQSESEVQQTVRILKDNHVYDVERGITGRAMLLSLTPVEHFMVAGLHPLVADGFSFQTLLRGVQELYLDPDSSHIKNRRRQFADHSEQQHVNLAAGKFDDDIRFWREQFASVPPSLPILTISNLTQRPAIVAYENEEAVIRVSVETKKRVQTICRRYRITPFHFYLAAFRTLLLRYTPIGSADDDVVVGIGDANRTEDELVDVIGPLVNILPIRLGASESMEFDELLRETRDKMYGALEHSRVPMQVLLNRLNIPRSAVHTPLFQCFVNYRQGLRETTSWDAPQKTGPVMSSVEIGIPKVAYDVSLEMVDYVDGECRQTLVVRQDMYGADDARRLARSLERLIEAFVADPTICLNEPELFDSHEIIETTKFSRGPSWKSQWPDTIVHRIEEVGVSHPHSIAVWHDNKTSTYEEVLRNANAIASALKAAQVTAGSPVAILQEPSAGFVSSLLGIMRIGAAYLPLDLSHPWARLAAMVQDCRPQVVLVDEENLHNTSRLEQPGIQIIHIGSLELDVSPVPISVVGESLATILYTSGSSGKPKGILLHHQALRHWAEPIQDLYEVAAETVIQQTTWTFDISLAQVLTALCFGGRLVLVPRNHRGDAKVVTELIASQNVTLIFSTPSEYSTWFNYGGEALRRAVSWKTAFTGGEALPTSVVEHFRSRVHIGTRLYSLYGPGECATNATAIQVPLDDNANWGSGPVAVGRPVPHYSVYVVDSKLRPVAVGVQGEICIGGPGVGRGYIENTKLTSERFVQNVLASTEDIENGWTTLHRTGDLGRWRRDGTLLIEGRISGDGQVKIRGYRVDLGEVEHAIIEAADGGVLEAIVSKRELTNSRLEFLVAHITYNKTLSDRAAQDCIVGIQERLSLKLPAYMCPAVIQPLDRIPLTSSGKLDRRAAAILPILEAETDVAEVDVAEPNLTETELRLKRIWQQVLCDQQSRWHGSITPDRDFFHVGGTSMHLLELQSRIEETFGGLQIPLTDMFDASSLAAMARRIERGYVDIENERLIGTEDWDRETAVPISLLAPVFSCTTAETRETAESSMDRAHIIILTGATGQLGSAILRTMVENAHVAHVHCIGVRNAADRKNSLDFPLNGKVTLHEGDLYQPKLGLSDDDASHIFAQATAIIHCAADKSYHKSFASLRAPNLQTTMDLAIMAAAASGPIPPPDFHYVSTASLGMLVADSKSGEHDAKEGFVFGPISVADYPPPVVDSSHVRRTAHGYMASKWASEVFLERLQTHHPGWRIVIHRPGLIERPPAEKEDDSNNGPVNDMLEALQYYAPRLRAVPALDTSKLSIRGVFDVISLAEVVNGMKDSILFNHKKHNLLTCESDSVSDQASGVEFLHHVSHVQLPLDDMGSWLGEAAERAEGGDAWQKLPGLEWARSASRIGMRPALVGLFESVAAKEGRVRFYKASRC